MKSFIVYSLSFIVFLFVQLYPIPYTLFPVQAHLAGQPPYFKINGKYANLYPVMVTTIQDFDLPQDLAPENYLVNVPVHFEIDMVQLPAPPDVVKRTKFTWEFGDGGKSTGLSDDYTYKKPGSYMLSLFADDGTVGPQLLDKVLIHILPSSDYQLPVARILVSGQSSKDPLNDILKLKFTEPVSFDGSKSESKSSKIVSYFWDFGDQQTSSDPKVSHNLPKDQSQVFPLLRVKDANGFISDSFVEIQNADLTAQNPILSNKQIPMTAKKNSSSQLVYSLVVIGIVISGILGFRILTSKR